MNRNTLVFKTFIGFSLAFVLSLIFVFYFHTFRQPEVEPHIVTSDENNATLKIMSFNVLSEPLCRGREKHRQEMKAIMDYAKSKNISLLALQEVVKQKDEINEECKFDLPQYLEDNAQGYSLTKSEYINIENDPEDFEKWWYRIFIHDTPLVGDMTRYHMGHSHRGFDAIVLNTKVGPIRFIHIHNGHHQIMDDLVPYTQQFRAQDDIPMIVLGDFNIIYSENGEKDTYERMKILEDSGFYRACDPKKFTNGKCNDTVRAVDSVLAIDHILIDKRAKFIVKDAYVDPTIFNFSDHFPVVVELEKVPEPTPIPTANASVTPPPTNVNIASINTNAWAQVKPATGNIYPWTNGGPTTGWESYLANYVYICNTKYCWVYDRNSSVWTNNGNPFALDTDPSYGTNLKPSGSGLTLWMDNGPTSAWTWYVNVDNKPATETLLCNQNYCWRYLRYLLNSESGWRDNGYPIYLPTYNDFWKDARVAPLWEDKGVTVAWTDPINSRITLCNKNDCRSLDYKTWQWRFNGEKIQPYPSPTVTEYNAAWTSPATNIISLCTKNSCWQYDIQASKYSTSPVIISTDTGGGVPTPTPNPSSSPIPTDVVCDLKTDQQINIQDFVSFVEYYKTNDIKSDLNKNGKAKEIADFIAFVNCYKAGRE